MKVPRATPTRAVSRDDLIEALSRDAGHPASARELMQSLRVPREERVRVGRQLRVMADEGTLVEVRRNRYALPGRLDLIVGRLSMHADGFGFVTADRIDPDGDVFVSRANLGDAMHGDRVTVRVERRRADRRREGRILRVLERRNPVIVGRFESAGRGPGQVVPFDRRQVLMLGVPRGEEHGAEPGEMVVAEITRWPSSGSPPLGRVVERLGPLDAPGVDAAIILRQHGIPDEHGRAAIEEAARLGRHVRPRDLEGRTDFRSIQTITIDGEQARDFDDAVTLEVRPNGHFWLGVHIADVSHYVREGSALDEEARDRGTSVYFPERAVHMFPPELATGLCSLVPGVDRLVQSCLMELDGNGNVVRYELHDGVIVSDARMTYTEVNGILTDRDPDLRARHHSIVPLIERLAAVYRILNARRRRRGAIDFDLPEPELVLDAEGMVEAVMASERNIAHRMIEEAMLLANETVASHLEQSEVPGLYRVHDTPDPGRVEEFAAFVAGLGLSFTAAPGGVEPRHFQELIERLHDKPEQKPIALLMLRTMALARYDAHNTGHFGLAASAYTHFTSPIRRYPDLVVHRLLRESRRGSIAPARVETLAQGLPELARHTSERERRAVEAERELVHWKKVRFMADKVGDEFSGYLVGVSTFGLFVELIEHFVEGLVHVSTMADDEYRYLEASHSMVGEKLGRRFRLGDRVRVRVVRVDLDQRRIELGLVELLDKVESRRGSRARVRTARLAKARGPRRGRKPIERRRRRR